MSLESGFVDEGLLLRNIRTSTWVTPNQTSKSHSDLRRLSPIIIAFDAGEVPSLTAQKRDQCHVFAIICPILINPILTQIQLMSFTLNNL